MGVFLSGLIDFYLVWGRWLGFLMNYFTYSPENKNQNKAKGKREREREKKRLDKRDVERIWNNSNGKRSKKIKAKRSPTPSTQYTGEDTPMR